MNILIVAPSFKILGGVANHYAGLNPHWSNHITYSVYGKRPHIPAIFSLVPDYIAFILRLIFTKVDIVIVNPSLRNYQLRRDAVYLKTALLFKKKVVTFIHGWDYDIYKKIEKNPDTFRNTYGRSKFIYVLCSDFKDSLTRLNLKAHIILTTTKVSDILLNGFDAKSRNGQIRNILFLARIEKSKGIFTTLEAYNILIQTYPDIRLSICGTGSALEAAKDYVNKNDIKNVTFYGNIKGDQLRQQFIDNDIYILPTHGEGMATSVLEAMAFGLPVISRPVGGVKDFFINGKMGFLIDSLEPYDYANAIKKYIENPDLVRQTAILNQQYAKEHFLASSVTKKFEDDLKKYCK